MAVYEMKQKGRGPIWEFRCPLCGEEWSEDWTIQVSKSIFVRSTYGVIT